MTSELYIGLMSGTSLDGIDAVLACFEPERQDVVLAQRFEPFEAALQSDLRALLQPDNDEIHRSAIAAHRLSHAYARCVRALLDDASVSAAQIAAIGCHGQTVRHNPADRYTTQIVDGALLAEATGITVVCDFRSRDMAAGGQGAPLVPAFHARFFGRADVARVIINIGGIANITSLPRSADVAGFDCGPGNTLMDEWIRVHRHKNFDADGAWATQGHVIPHLLARLASTPYFSAPPPKSTGRELFNLEWLSSSLEPEYAPADVQATLCQLTAESIVDALERHCPGTSEVYVCGGGAANADLMRRLRARLAETVMLHTTERLGIHPDWVEAAAFAWLARETMGGRPGNLPVVTGAAGPRVLGCIYPA